MTDAKPEGEQLRALQLMREWYRNWRTGVRGTPNFFYLAGFAGVGKTFIVKHFLKEEKLSEFDVSLMTFMARSAIILERASGIPATTVHSQIYRKIINDRGQEEWALNQDSAIRESKLIILDECSTIGSKMFKDILYFNRPILILGDPGQLLPVKDEPFFQSLKPDFFLTEIRRQALDNPIIRLSMMVRNGLEIPHGQYGDSKKVPAAELPIPEWVDASILLVWTNDLRNNLNRTYRTFLEFEQQSRFPVKGDRLICLKNNHALGLTNGTLGTATGSVENPGNEFTFPLEFTPENSKDSVNVQAITSVFSPRTNATGMIIQDPDFIEKRYMKFDYAYAITGHKALGSQFESVIVVDHGDQRDRARWLYTAITRAVDKLTIVT